MLTSWGLKNYKSIYEADIELAPLTILTGTNSSGKSSLIQSMLLIAQTIADKDEENPLTQAGKFLDIVNFEDIRSYYENGKEGKKFEPLEFRWNYEFKNKRYYKNRLPGKIWDKIVATPSFNYSIDEYYKKVNGEINVKVIFDCDNVNSGQMIFKPKICIVKESIKSGDGNENIPLGEIQITENEKGEKDVFFNEEFVLDIKIVETVMKEKGVHFLPKIKIKFEVPRVNDFKPIIIRGSSDLEIEQAFSAEIEEVTKSYKKNANQLEYNSFAEENSIFLERVIAELNDYFTKQFKYLGPLRVHDSIHKPTKADDPKDVGREGENCAVVIDANKDKKVMYISSKVFNQIITGNMETEKIVEKDKLLGDALNDWLKYLDVAYRIEPKRINRGYELKFIVNENFSVNLSEVGTGVSQVLPVLVSCLLADTGSTLIFEQPELHLHPKVQSRLADFFISMALLDKQCIIETHSEYFIDKLRLRICQSLLRDNVEIKKLAKIYFFDKNGLETSIKEIEINEFGDYNIWPNDFFDELQHIGDDILNSINEKMFKNESSINEENINDDMKLDNLETHDD